jgi:hypothetical protein
MTSIGQKADYVRSEVSRGHDGKHTCHWTGCRQRVAPAVWGCKKHWYMLPDHLRAEIWAAFRPGQEQDKRPSPRYRQAAKTVEAWIAANHPPAPVLL